MARNTADDLLEELASFVTEPTTWLNDVFPNDNPKLISSVSEHTDCLHSIIKKVVELKRHGRGLQSDVDASVSYSWNLSDALKPERGLFRFDDKENTAKILEVLARDSKFSKLGLRSDSSGGGSRGGQGGGVKKRPGAKGKGPKPKPKRKTCFSCGDSGHIRPNCPVKDKKDKKKN